MNAALVYVLLTQARRGGGAPMPTGCLTWFLFGTIASFILLIVLVPVFSPDPVEMSKTHYCEKVPYKQYKYGKDSYYCHWVPKPKEKQLKATPYLIKGDTVSYLIK